MSILRRSIGTIAVAVLTLTLGSAAAHAQINTIKDGWLVMKIHSEFVDEDVLAGSNIDVDVKNGIVTLQGTVPSEAARARAIAAAKANDGVKGVTDQLRIAPAARDNGNMDRAGDKSANAAKKTGRAIDDGWIKSKIYAQYMSDWNTVLDDSNIDIDVTNNVVVLNGTVKSAAAKTKAVAIAKSTDGVKSVNDNLKIVAGAQ